MVFEIEIQTTSKSFLFFLIQIYFKFAPGLECHITPLFILQWVRGIWNYSNGKDSKWNFKSGLTPHSLSFKLWRSHFISSLESPWVAWSLHYFQMRFQIISDGNTFGKVLLFPLIQLSKSFKLHSISPNHSHNNQTNNQNYLFNITFQNLEFWDVTVERFFNFASLNWLLPFLFATVL